LIFYPQNKNGQELSSSRVRGGFADSPAGRRGAIKTEVLSLKFLGSQIADLRAFSNCADFPGGIISTLRAQRASARGGEEFGIEGSIRG